MKRALVSIFGFWLAWGLFLAWLSNHRVAARGRFGMQLPELSVLEAWIVPALVWLAASWWCCCSAGAHEPRLPAAGVLWRTLLLGVFMLGGAFLVWLGLMLLA